MVFKFLIIMGTICLILTILAKIMNSSKLLSIVIRRYKQETDEVFFNRAYKNALCISIGFIICGLIGSLI